VVLLVSGVLCAAQSVPTPATATSGPCGSNSGQTPCAAATPASSTRDVFTPPTGASAPSLRPAPEVSTVTPSDEQPLARPELPSAPATTVGLPLAPSEFELFAEDAAGQPLPVYGRQLFRKVPTTFAPVDHVPVPANYVLGPGDQLLIRVWGKIDLDTTVTVDRSGQIFVPRVGALSVAGLRYEQVESYIRSAVASLYKDFELNVTMGQLRSIQIFVLGSARQPGAYTVSSLSTLVNALFASGGPSATGSMRRIQLRRAGQVVTEFDVYDLLRGGDKSHDAQLLPGDVIYIPPVGPQVAIYGSVDEPGIYELKGGTTIAAALEDTGGLTSLAETDRVLLERIENHRRRHVDEFALDASGLSRALEDGDILQIFPISPRFGNAVTLRGNVVRPGRFPWHEGMRVSDLFPSRDSLITRWYWNQQNHLVTPLTTADGKSQTGAPGPALDVLNDLTQNSAEINWDYAAIERLDERDLSTHVIAFNLGDAIDNQASPDNQFLKMGDVITIFSRRDLPLPQDKHAAFVRVGGEVNAPGVYRIKPGETLREVVERAGGLTPHSYLYASQLTRTSARQKEEEQLRLSINQMQRELTSRYASTPSLNSTSAVEQQGQLAAQQAVIAQLSAVHPTGRVVLGMKPLASTVTDIPDFPLEDGDSFYIPPKLGTVLVAGAVYNENAFRFQPGKHLAVYLKDAGGPTRQADTKRTFLIRADGTVVSSQSKHFFWGEDFERLALLSGDAIIVPAKLKSPGGFAQQLPYLTGIISQTALTGMALGTLY
jgi:polysaccharide biosynthesis/export protein